uniref:Uncharacterized protein n=1 Tax=Anguilla anguilla TaxID=7936 RepID=A0A0E9WDB2_ANGAN
MKSDGTTELYCELLNRRIEGSFYYIHMWGNDTFSCWLISRSRLIISP